MHEANYTKFYDIVASTDWSNIINETNCQNSFSLFHKKISTIYDNSFPMKKIKIKYKNKLPWLSDGLKTSIKKKNNLYATLKKVRYSI